MCFNHNKLIMVLLIILLSACVRSKQYSKAEIKSISDQLLEESKSPKYKLTQVNNIYVLGADWCPACQSLKSYLDSTAMPYTYIETKKDASANDIVQMLGGSIPVVLINKGLENNDFRAFIGGKKLILHMLANPKLFEEYKQKNIKAQKESQQSSIEELLEEEIMMSSKNGFCKPDGLCTNQE